MEDEEEGDLGVSTVGLRVEGEGVGQPETLRLELRVTETRLGLDWG